MRFAIAILSVEKWYSVKQLILSIFETKSVYFTKSFYHIPNSHFVSSSG